MTEEEISKIANKGANDTKFWIGLVGAIGALIGSFLTIIGNITVEWFKNRHQRKVDKARQKLLKKMLGSEKYEWRNLSTLSAVIGCDDENTKNHLIAIDARGSETNDGKWGMISRHPLEEIK